MPSARAPILPVSAIFLAHGLMLGAWATQIPILRDRLAIAPAALGLALLSISIGAIAVMPFVARLTARCGAPAILRGGTAIAGLALAAAALAPSYAVLCAALAAFGLGFGTVDVAMNGCAVQTEHAAGRPILGAVHAMWSIGAFAGSAAGALLLAVATPGAQAALLAAAAALTIAIAAGDVLSPQRHAEPHAPAERPWQDRRLLVIGVLLCLGFAVEGAVADWGGIYLHAHRHLPANFAALGYSAFSVSMVAMRLLGDRLRARIGDQGVLAMASVATLGIAAVLLAPTPALSIAGFAIVGLGIANVVPALFALAGARGVNGPGAAVGVATTLGYAGVLLGPPCFGAVAQATSLPTAIALVAALSAIIAAAGLSWRKAAPLPPPHRHSSRSSA